MGVVSRLWVLAALLLVLPGPALAQDPPDPGVVRDALAPVLDQAAQTLVPQGENATGEDLHGEDISVAVALDATNIEYQLYGIVFGGGKVQVDVKAAAVLEFRAVSVERLDAALKAFSGDQNASLNATFGVPVHRAALTAEEIRLVGAGALLEAFQSFEAEAARGYLTAMVPGLRVLSLEAAWSNTEPASYLEPPDPSDPPAPSALDPTSLGVPPLREPPLTLGVDLDLQYLQRYSLYDILRSREVTNETDPDDVLRERIEENQTLPLAQRNAFQVMGFGQLLDLSIPHGWRLDVQVTFPKGFTVESVTDELRRGDDQQMAVFSLDGRTRLEDAALAGVVTVSNRSLVTTTLFVLVLLVGIVLRVLVELASMTWVRWRHNRTKA